MARFRITTTYTAYSWEEVNAEDIEEVGRYTVGATDLDVVDESNMITIVEAVDQEIEEVKAS